MGSEYFILLCRENPCCSHDVLVSQSPLVSDVTSQARKRSWQRVTSLRTHKPQVPTWECVTWEWHLLCVCVEPADWVEPSPKRVSLIQTLLNNSRNPDIENLLQVTYVSSNWNFCQQWGKKGWHKFLFFLICFSVHQWNPFTEWLNLAWTTAAHQHWRQSRYKTDQSLPFGSFSLDEKRQTIDKQGTNDYAGKENLWEGNGAGQVDGEQRVSFRWSEEPLG
jgi:hypothetical protein